MSRSLVLGNGTLLLCFDHYGLLRDFYYPYAGLENHISSGDSHKIGFFIDGHFTWITDREWQVSTDYEKGTHIRIHPLLHWTELNVWEYIERESIPVIPLYFADDKGQRYRSIGCAPCTFPVKSNARTVRDIVEELRASKIPERAGRAQDQESEDAFEKLRRDGYM